MATNTRAVRIANVSGYFGDRMRALAEMVQGGPVDVVTGDYLAEVTMMILGKLQARNPAHGYAPTFLMQLQPVLKTIVEKGIKVVVNAGGLNPRGLAEAVTGLGQKLGVAVKVAFIEGDDLRGRLDGLREGNRQFVSLETGVPLPTSEGFVHTANAYLGAFGIARALEHGADVVICPRVTDASLVVGAAAWWHGWQRDDYDQLAGAVAAGHVIECGAQATGGNYSSFRELGLSGVPGFPLAEVNADGSSVITKHLVHPGAVTVGTVTAQLVYEIGGTRYLNPDVVTRLETLELFEEAPNRVAITGAKGLPPPPTTKVAITTKGQFRNEMTLAFVGLDVDEKIEWVEKTVRVAAEKPGVKLLFQRIGAAATDASTQDAATVLLRVTALSDDEVLVSKLFSSSLIELGLSSYPGLFALDVPGAASEAGGYWPTLVQQRDVPQHVTFHDGTTEIIEAPARMEELVAIDTLTHGTAASAGDTERVPLGRLVDARSGDKGSDANVGLWVRSDDEYRWLQATLTVETLKMLLPEAKDLAVERIELPKLKALNFVIHGLLLGGAVATTRFDRQAKALGEFLRSRHLEIPTSLLALRTSTP